MSASDLTTRPGASHARTIAIVTVVAALIAGIMIGMVADRIWLWRHRDRIASHAMHAMVPRILAHLDAELALTPQQHEMVSAILERHRERVTAVFAAVRPQVSQEVDKANAEIEAVLTPEQRVRFEKVKLRVPGGRRRR